MPSLRAPFLALAAVAASVIFAGPATAYVRTRSSDGKYDAIWPDPRITMTVRTGGTLPVSVDDFVTAATRAMATWSDPALASSIAYTAATAADTPADPGFDHENTISFRAAWDPPVYQDGELALTTVWTQGGRIVDADTEINTADSRFHWAVLPDEPAVAALSGDVDLQNALTHELGHVLGLDHPCYLGEPPDPPEKTNEGLPVPSCSDPALPASVRAATMYPSSTPGDIGERTLSPDEILALHDLYPAGRAPVVEGEAASASGGCAVAGGGVTPWAGLLGATALLLGRRRGGLGRRGAPR